MSGENTQSRPWPLEIVYYPDPVLRRKATPYEADQFGPELAELARRVLASMYLAHGVGLAAPQVAISRRMIVIDVSAERNQGLALVNPVLVETRDSQLEEERCLSLPHEEIVGMVRRRGWARCAYETPEGEPCQIEGDGLLARVLQHEIDHLDGVLFVDRVSSAKKISLRKHLRELEDPHKPRG